jgi:hypothetical protein
VAGVRLGDERVLQRHRDGPVPGEPDVGARDPAPGRGLRAGGGLVDRECLVGLLVVQVGQKLGAGAVGEQGGLQLVEDGGIAALRLDWTRYSRADVPMCRGHPLQQDLCLGRLVIGQGDALITDEIANAGRHRTGARRPAFREQFDDSRPVGQHPPFDPDPVTR